MKITPLNPHTGAEITGVDVKTLDDAGFAPIYETWLKYGIIVVRDQKLEVDDYVRYSERFGHVVTHPSKSTRHPDHPKITMLGVNKFNADGNLNKLVYARGASGFHTDGAYDEVPFKATGMYCLAVPSRGGNTFFSSMYAAYDALPRRLRDLLAGRRGAFTYGGRRKRSIDLLNPEDQQASPVLHDLIKVHPETGRTSLYFDPGKILYIEGLEQAESDAVIDELTGLMIVDDAVYSHKWEVGDAVIWDNRSMVHKAAGDYPPEEDRIHWRVSVKDSLEGARVAAE